MSSDRECYVYIVLPGATEFVTAGRFRVSTGPTGDPAGAFVYGRRYRELTEAVELDPVELRLADHVYETGRMGGFFGAIRDAMPDSWGRRVIERRVGHARLEEFDHLLGGPDDRAGALGFGLAVEPPACTPRFSGALELDRLQRAADAVVAGEPDCAGLAGAQVEELLWPGTSLGGARPKAVVQDSDGLWIAKFGSRNDRWNHPRVEHGTLALARACGLQVADSRMETVADRDVLLVRRFDRERTETGYRRHRMVSALTLLRAGDSAVDRANWSYLLLADEIRRASTDPRTDLRELFGRMCFNAANLQSRRSPPQSRDRRQGPRVAPQPGVRPDAVSGRRAGPPRPGDALWSIRQVRQPGQPAERLRPVPVAERRSGNHLPEDCRHRGCDVPLDNAERWRQRDGLRCDPRRVRLPRLVPRRRGTPIAPEGKSCTTTRSQSES